MTETIKVEVDEELARRFRRRAMEKYGYKRGAIKRALEELMSGFASTSAASQPQIVDWSFLEGSLKDSYKGMTSVELQHALWRINLDSHRHKRVS